MEAEEPPDGAPAGGEPGAAARGDGHHPTVVKLPPALNTLTRAGARRFQAVQDGTMTVAQALEEAEEEEEGYGS